MMLLTKISMLGIANIFQKIVDFLTGFFAWIPQLIYFLYAAAASVLDLLQFIIRKLAGLDVYYVDGDAVSGDIVSSFIRGILGIDNSATYSALSTVFWSMIIFGAILLVITTIFAIIKAHYNYDSAKSNPFYIIGQTFKSACLMALVPVIAVFGVYFCNVVLQALDQITSYENAMGDVFEKGAVSNALQAGKVRGTDRTSYTSYDFFRAGAYTNSTTFSGALFKVAAYDCNRVRLGSFYYVPDNDKYDKGWTNFGLFYSRKGGDEARAAVAEQIDFAFANNLTLKEDHRQNASLYMLDTFQLQSSLTVGYSLAIAGGLIHVRGFSKYNIALVWYFYNLWVFNWFIAFAGIITFLTVLSNVVFGLMVRMIQLLALFFVFPPLIGISPLDGGGAFTKWKQQYISDLLMAFGAIIGMNLFFIIMPFLNTISFFNAAFLDNIMNVVIMLAALTMVKNFIGTLSGFIGASDANKIGEETKGSVGKLAQKAGGMTLKAASLGVKMFKASGGGLVGQLVGKAHSKLKERRAKKAEEEAQTQAQAEQAIKAGDINKAKEILGGGDAKKGEKAYNKLKKKQDDAKEAQQVANYRAEMEEAEKITDPKEKAKRIEEIKNKYDDKVIKRANGNGFKRALAFGFSTLFGGGQIKRGADGSIDAGATFRTAGTAILNVGKEALKFEFGDLLQGGGLLKTLKSKESGVGDALRGFVGNFGALGESINESKVMQTEKTNEDASKAAAGQESAAISETNTNTKLMYRAIESLVTELEK